MILKKSGLVLAIGLIVILTACGRQETTAPSGARMTAATGTSAPAAAPVPASAARPGETPATLESTTITRINEDGSESVEDTSTDNGAHNTLLTAVAASFSASASAATTLSPPTPWQEGVNYTRLVPAQPTSAPAGQVEVIEFFWYSCPHCNVIDPLVEAWRKTKAPY